MVKYYVNRVKGLPIPDHYCFFFTAITFIFIYLCFLYFFIREEILTFVFVNINYLRRDLTEFNMMSFCQKPFRVRNSKFRSFRLNFSNNKDPSAICDTDQLNCGTSLIHNPFANVNDPNYFLNRFPFVESALFPWTIHSSSIMHGKCIKAKTVFSTSSAYICVC